MPAQGEDDPAKRAVVHECENWAALNSDDLQSPKVMIFFLDHLQSKKPVLLTSIVRTNIKGSATGLFEKAVSRIENRILHRPDDDAGVWASLVCDLARFL